MFRSLIVLAAVSGVMLAPMAHPVADRDPRRVEMIGPQEKLLPIELNKGQLVRLGAPAASVFIADPAIADVQVKSPTLVYVFGKRAGETTMFAVDGGDRILANLKVSVSHNLSNLKTAISTLFPGGFIEVSSVGQSVMLSGVVSSAREAEDARALAARFVGEKQSVINRLSVNSPNQVNLRVRVAEVQRSVLKRIGVNWESIMSVGSFIFGLGIGRDFITDGQIIRSPAGTDDINVGVRTESVDINALIEALENEGLVTVLAEPNLTAVSGETASFLAGGEFPILVPGDDDKVTVEFKEFGVALAFTPTIVQDGRINLKVRPEVSQLSTTGEVRIDNVQIPSLSTRRAETTVELGSGQSFAIAGLIQNNVTHDLHKFPGLGDVPVLGALFRSDRFQRDETELVIIVTPYVVRPVSSARLRAPTDGLVWPTDNSRVMDGEVYKPQMREKQPAIRPRGGQNLMGAAGFTLE